MFASTKVWASKMKNLRNVIVASVTPTWPVKSLVASSLGDVPGGNIAKSNCANDFTLLFTIASISSWLSPALAARCLNASVEYTKEAASLGAAAITPNERFGYENNVHAMIGQFVSPSLDETLMQKL
jgi:hypothetical protein